MSSQPGSTAKAEPARELGDNNIVEFASNPAAPKVTFPVPRWVQTALGVVALLASIAGAMRPLVRSHLDHDKQTETLGRFTEVQVTENQRHSGEDSDQTIPVLSRDGGERIQLKHYRSDGCLLVVRSTPDGVVTSRLWVPRFSGAEMTPPPGAVGYVQHVETETLAETGQSSFAALLSDRLPFTAGFAFGDQSHPMQACSGRCSEHHRGQPTTSYGKTNGCWLQVVRTWPDGCSQYQWYDACHSVWDGKIYWTCCKD
jgi:hypothetical protein